MKAGTIIALDDGREATVVYNGLDGQGIAWGVHILMPDECDWPPLEAMLREPYPSADVPCIGEGKFRIVSEPISREAAIRSLAENQLRICHCYGRLCSFCQAAKSLLGDLV